MFLTQKIKVYEIKGGKAELYRHETDGKPSMYQLSVRVKKEEMTSPKIFEEIWHIKTDKTAKKWAINFLEAQGLSCGHFLKGDLIREGFCRFCWKAEYERNYEIVRMYYPVNGETKRPRRTGINNLTLNEAQAHCKDPKTRKEGVYFDGYQEMKG